MLKKFLCICIFYLNNSQATTYNNTGNDTTNYVITSNTVQSAARGFVYFTNGIIFDGTVNVSLPVPISGNIQFGTGNTSKIILEADLTIGSTGGTEANAITITTSSGYAEIAGCNGTIFFNGDTFLPFCRSIRILSNLTLDGCGHEIIFGNLTTFTIESGTTLTICNATLRRLQTLNFVGSGSLILDNTSIILDYDWTYSGNALFGTPSLSFRNDTIVKGIGKKFIYAGGRDLTLFSNACLFFDLNTSFSWASKRRNGFIMGKIENNTPGFSSLLAFNNSTIAIPSRGSNNGLYIKIPTYPFSTGAIIFNNHCGIYNDSNTNINKSFQYDETPAYLLGGANVDVDGLFYDAGKSTIGGQAEVAFHPTMAPFNMFTYNDSWVSSYPLFKATFSIAANQDAIVIISNTKGATSGNSTVRTITIGANSNTNFLVRKGDLSQAATTLTPPGGMTILNGIGSYAQFWITYDQVSGLLKIGQGSTIDQNVFVQWTDTTPLAGSNLYFGVGGWINASGQIVYYKNITIV